jgi:hypothetical protein
LNPFSIIETNAYLFFVGRLKKDISTIGKEISEKGTIRNNTFNIGITGYGNDSKVAQEYKPFTDP